MQRNYFLPLTPLFGADGRGIIVEHTVEGGTCTSVGALVFMLDYSGSMTSHYATLHKFLDTCTRAGITVIVFSSRAMKVEARVDGAPDLSFMTNGSGTYGGGTCFAAAFRTCSEWASGAKVVMFTDGEHNSGLSYAAPLAELKENAAQIVTAYLGHPSTSSIQVLTDISGTPPHIVGARNFDDFLRRLTAGRLTPLVGANCVGIGDLSVRLGTCPEGVPTRAQPPDLPQTLLLATAVLEYLKHFGTDADVHVPALVTTLAIILAPYNNSDAYGVRDLLRGIQAVAVQISAAATIECKLDFVELATAAAIAAVHTPTDNLRRLQADRKRQKVLTKLAIREAEMKRYIDQHVTWLTSNLRFPCTVVTYDVHPDVRAALNTMQDGACSTDAIVNRVTYLRVHLVDRRTVASWQEAHEVGSLPLVLQDDTAPKVLTVSCYKLLRGCSAGTTAPLMFLTLLLPNAPHHTDEMAMNAVEILHMVRSYVRHLPRSPFAPTDTEELFRYGLKAAESGGRLLAMCEPFLAPREALGRLTPAEWLDFFLIACYTLALPTLPDLTAAIRLVRPLGNGDMEEAVNQLCCTGVDVLDITGEVSLPSGTISNDTLTKLFFECVRDGSAVTGIQSDHLLPVEVIKLAASIQLVRIQGIDSETARHVVAQGLRSVPSSDIEALATLDADQDIRRGLHRAMRLLLAVHHVSDQGVLGAGELHTVLKECRVTFSPLGTVHLHLPKTKTARRVAAELISCELQPYLQSASPTPDQLVALARFTNVGAIVERMLRSNAIAPASLPWNTVFPLVVHHQATAQLWRCVDPSSVQAPQILQLSTSDAEACLIHFPGLDVKCSNVGLSLLLDKVGVGVAQRWVEAQSLEQLLDGGIFAKCTHPTSVWAGLAAELCSIAKPLDAEVAAGLACYSAFLNCTWSAIEVHGLLSGAVPSAAQRRFAAALRDGFNPWSADLALAERLSDAAFRQYVLVLDLEVKETALRWVRGAASHPSNRDEKTGQMRLTDLSMISFLLSRRLNWREQHAIAVNDSLDPKQRLDDIVRIRLQRIGSALWTRCDQARLRRNTTAIQLMRLAVYDPATDRWGVPETVLRVEGSVHLMLAPDDDTSKYWRLPGKP